MSEYTVQDDITTVRRMIDRFKAKKFLKTTARLKSILKNLSEGFPSEWQDDYDNTSQTYAEEIERMGEYPTRCLDELNKIWDEAFKQEERLTVILNDILPFLNEQRKTINNLNRLYSILDGIENKTETEEYYLTCFIYVVSIEGNYENWMKIIYHIYYNMIQGHKSYLKTEKIKLAHIKDWMIKNGLSSIIFQGYEDGHIRNAIAHAHFEYLEPVKKMSFRDPPSGWSKEYTHVKFKNILYKINVLTEMCQDMIWFLLLLDLLRRAMDRMDS